MSDGIKTMKLYHQVERVFNELRALGIADNDSIDVEQLCRFDQYHYLGTDAVHESVDALGLVPDTEVLEVGSGIGGPSRYLAHAARCRMTALELQEDLDSTAQQLTERCGLDKRVKHVCGDILQGAPGKGFDAVVSWLTFLHIPQRNELYQVCFNALKPGGGLFFEDYFEKNTLTPDERSALRDEVFCERVPTLDEYRQELSDNGFIDIKLIDKSSQWSDFVDVRMQQFEADRDRNIALHGEELVDGLSTFYATVARLFKGGNLGGICVTARKPV